MHGGGASGIDSTLPLPPTNASFNPTPIHRTGLGIFPDAVSPNVPLHPFA